MDAKYKIGDKVWVASFDRGKPIKVPCCVCYGKLRVTLILGNGDRIELPCDYCGKGNLGNPIIPPGYEIEYQPCSEPKSIIIDGMSIDVTHSGEKVEYWVGTDSWHTIYYEDNVFDSYEKALTKGEELKAEWLKIEKTRADHIKFNIKKSFVWNAGYHLRQAKQAEKDFIYHKEQAKLCKERSK